MKTEVTPLQKALNIWAITLILWSLYRGFFKTELPLWFDEIIAKPLIFLGPLYYYITRKEGKNFLRSIDLRNKYMKSGILWGLVFGGIFFIVGLISSFLKDSLNFVFTVEKLLSLFYLVLIALVTSFSEEALSRGFALKRLYETSKNLFSAVFFSSLLYFFIRVPILFTDPKIQGPVLVQVMLTDIIFSFAVSFLYIQKRSLFVPLIIHIFYILSVQFFLSVS